MAAPDRLRIVRRRRVGSQILKTDSKNALIVFQSLSIGWNYCDKVELLGLFWSFGENLTNFCPYLCMECAANFPPRSAVVAPLVVVFCPFLSPQSSSSDGRIAILVKREGEGRRRGGDLWSTLLEWRGFFRLRLFDTILDRTQWGFRVGRRERCAAWWNWCMLKHIPNRWPFSHRSDNITCIYF